MLVNRVRLLRAAPPKTSYFCIHGKYAEVEPLHEWSRAIHYKRRRYNVGPKRPGVEKSISWAMLLESQMRAAGG